jgi:signal transduction histidine kinase
LLVAVLKTSKFRGVVAVRVFDAGGTLNSADGIVGPLEPPAREDWRRVAAGEAFARLRPKRPDDEVFVLPEGTDGGRMIEAWVPLHLTRSVALVGVAQFWLEGGAAAAEIATHDRRLWEQAALAWGAGSLVIGLALVWAFRRVDRANRELRARGEDLERANRELVLAAKTSALGAVAAHLVHELKNPLAGLESLMAGQRESATGGREEDGGELAAATALTRRLRTMVNDVVGVLRDEQTGAAFAVSCADIAEILRPKVAPEAERRGVRLELGGDAAVSLPARRANLATLVLRNLIQNALEAVPPGGRVTAAGGAGPGGAVEFVVADEGPGLPEPVRARLFQPCTSSKAGGSGLGLALSSRLAQQAGGRLELVQSDAGGTRFRLVLDAEA